MGVPVVLPSKIPERKRTLSPSLRWVTIADCPGRRRSSSCCMASKSKKILGGQPSMMPPNASPCDSPKVVSLKSVPKLLPAIYKSFILVTNTSINLLIGVLTIIAITGLKSPLKSSCTSLSLSDISAILVVS